MGSKRQNTKNWKSKLCVCPTVNEISSKEPGDDVIPSLPPEEFLGVTLVCIERYCRKTPYFSIILLELRYVERNY